MLEVASGRLTHPFGPVRVAVEDSLGIRRHPLRADCTHDVEIISVRATVAATVTAGACTWNASERYCSTRRGPGRKDQGARTGRPARHLICPHTSLEETNFRKALNNLHTEWSIIEVLTYLRMNRGKFASLQAGRTPKQT